MRITQSRKRLISLYIFLFLSRSTGIELCLNCLIFDFLKSLVNPISRSNLLREILYWPVAYLGFKPPINEVQPAIQCKTSSNYRSLVPTTLRHRVFFVRNKYTSTTTLFTVYYHCSCVSLNSLNMARNTVFLNSQKNVRLHFEQAHFWRYIFLSC